MNIELQFQQSPLWVFYVFTIAVVVLSVIFGYYLGGRFRKQGERDKEAPIGAAVGAILGLLAFTLAFTFGMSASTYKDRMDLLLDEVGAIETAYLRTGLLPAPQRTESRKLFRQYVDIRAETILEPEKIPQALVDSEAIHDQLWSQIVTLAQQDNKPDSLGMVSLYIQSLSEVIVMHTRRVVTGLQYRIPAIIWLILFAVTIFAMTGVGYQFGIIGTKSWLVILLLALSFSAIILLIADLDRATSGLFKVSQQPMLELRQKLDLSVGNHLQN